MALDTHTDSLVSLNPKSSGGESLGQSASDLVSLHGATPVIQRVGAAQAVVVALAGSLTGSADGTIADIAATAGSCSGTTTPSATNVDSAIATAVASIVTGTNLQLKELQAVLNLSIILSNELRAALVEKGILKGGA